MISLSYILTTFNKLAYLKISLPYLIASRQQDEEIVIVDGGSKDGARDVDGVLTVPKPKLLAETAQPERPLP